MGVNLSKGQRVSLDKNMTMALVGLGWDPNQYDGGFDFDLDASAFLLGKNGKVLKDEDFVFYGNQNARNGAVMSMGDDTSGGNSEDGDDEQLLFMILMFVIRTLAKYPMRMLELLAFRAPAIPPVQKC